MLFHESNPEKRTNHSIKPSAEGASLIWEWPSFEKSACFYVTITGNFGRFHYFNSEINCLKIESFSQKTGVSFLNWKYSNWKRNISTQNYPVRSQCWDKNNWEYKMDLSEKKRSFASNCFIFFFFWKFCFSLEPLTKSFFDVWTTQMSVFILFVSAGVLFEGGFSYNHSIGNNCPEFHYRFLHSYFLETEQSVLKTIMTH